MRLVTIVLRGALDGLSAVAPVGDPDYAGLHGALALSLDGDHPALPLDGFFALNPAMPNLARLYKARQAAVVHATATAYRERSHFDGQDVLESGYAGPGRTDSGWLIVRSGRCPGARRVAASGLAVGAVAPLVIRGAAPVLGWAPHLGAVAGDDLARRVLDLYGHRDPALAAALADGLATDRMAIDAAGDKARGTMASPQGMRQAAEGAARLLAAPDGPRIAALAFRRLGHARERGGCLRPVGAVARRPRRCDRGSRSGSRRPLGRHDRGGHHRIRPDGHINGTVGTDHGTGTVSFLAGGAVKGGVVMADWPGLAPNKLYEARDLMPTTDLRAVLKGILATPVGPVAPMSCHGWFSPDRTS